VLDIDEEELARQLTLVENSAFVHIPAVDFFKRGWQEEKKKNRSPLLKKFLLRQSRFVQWIATIVLVTNPPTKAVRLKVLDKLLRLAQHLKTFNNFQSYFTIAAGLMHPLVQKHVVSELKERSVKEMMKELDATYRDVKQGADARRYREIVRALSSEDPMIPFLEVTLCDLLKLEELEPDTERGLINWIKRIRLFEIITFVQNAQSTPYNLQPVLQVQWIFDMDRQEESIFDDASLSKAVAEWKQ